MRPAYLPVVQVELCPAFSASPHPGEDVLGYYPWNIGLEASQHKVVISTNAVVCVKGSDTVIYIASYKGGRVLNGHTPMEVKQA